MVERNGCWRGDDRGVKLALHQMPTNRTIGSLLAPSQDVITDHLVFVYVKVAKNFFPTGERYLFPSPTKLDHLQENREISCSSTMWNRVVVNGGICFILSNGGDENQYCSNRCLSSDSKKIRQSNELLWDSSLHSASKESNQTRRMRCSNRCWDAEMNGG